MARPTQGDGARKEDGEGGDGKRVLDDRGMSGFRPRKTMGVVMFCDTILSEEQWLFGILPTKMHGSQS